MNFITQQLSDSASDFQNIVWPVISQTPLIGGGILRPVESVTTQDFAQELDLVAGIDAWQVIGQPVPSVRGIASRVQWGTPYDSFSVRLSSRFGEPTEFQKRLYALQNQSSGFIYPHITVQAYLDFRHGNLISAAAIETARLIGAAALLVENRERLQHPRPEFYGFIDNPDGTSFVYLRWQYLMYKGAMFAENVKYPGAEPV